MHARLMFIGEGPGAQEDLTGRPFVGAAGQLLDRMLAAIGLALGGCLHRERRQVQAAAESRATPDEARPPCPTCAHQVVLVRPQVIVLLGATPAKGDPGRGDANHARPG